LQGAKKVSEIKPDQHQEAENPKIVTFIPMRGRGRSQDGSLRHCVLFYDGSFLKSSVRPVKCCVASNR